MKINGLKSPAGARPARVRVGRGHGSGMGKTSGTGHGGQKRRSGFSLKPGFEGGQMPLFRRTPKKKGFKSHPDIIYAPVNLRDLKVDVSEVDVAVLKAAKLIPSNADRLKILSMGEVPENVKTLKAHKFSEAALEKLNKAKVNVVKLED